MNIEIGTRHYGILNDSKIYSFVVEKELAKNHYLLKYGGIEHYDDSGEGDTLTRTLIVHPQSMVGGMLWTNLLETDEDGEVVRRSTLITFPSELAAIDALLKSSRNYRNVCEDRKEELVKLKNLQSLSDKI